MMYSVRKTTKNHGNTNLVILCLNLIVTGFLAINFGSNYIVIFLASFLLHTIIESGLAVSGIRKSEVFVFGYKLPMASDVLLKSMVEGPAYCVPAFFIADQMVKGDNYWYVLAAFILVGLASLYIGFRDRKNIQALAKNSSPLISRRAMTKPTALMLLALINTICIVAILQIEQPYRKHALFYIIAYSLLVLLFYFINYNFGVRYVEEFNCKKQTYTKPSLGMQIAGLTYDSAYEMALLVSPAYWVTFYLGFFNFGY
jgi:hypothetical protein